MRFLYGGDSMRTSVLRSSKRAKKITKICGRDIFLHIERKATTETMGNRVMKTSHKKRNKILTRSKRLDRQFR